MLNELNKESDNIGIRINTKKTKVMFNSYAKVKQIKVNDDITETTDRYIYVYIYIYIYLIYIYIYIQDNL